jgi:hypothetical protein
MKPCYDCGTVTMVHKTWCDSNVREIYVPVLTQSEEHIVRGEN